MFQEPETDERESGEWRLATHEGYNFTLPKTMIFLGREECDVEVQVTYYHILPNHNNSKYCNKLINANSADLDQTIHTKKWLLIKTIGCSISLGNSYLPCIMYHDWILWQQLPYSTFLAPCALNFFRVAANFWSKFFSLSSHFNRLLYIEGNEFKD